MRTVQINHLNDYSFLLTTQLTLLDRAWYCIGQSLKASDLLLYNDGQRLELGCVLGHKRSVLVEHLYKKEEELKSLCEFD